MGKKASDPNRAFLMKKDVKAVRCKKCNKSIARPKRNKSGLCNRCMNIITKKRYYLRIKEELKNANRIHRKKRINKKKESQE